MESKSNSQLIDGFQHGPAVRPDLGRIQNYCRLRNVIHILADVELPESLGGRGDSLWHRHLEDTSYVLKSLLSKGLMEWFLVANMCMSALSGCR